MPCLVPSISNGQPLQPCCQSRFWPPVTSAATGLNNIDRWANNAGRRWRGNRNPTASINFVSAHDGFTLADLVSFNDKHNEANGENNRDGESHNLSWNCGAEGKTDRLDVNR